MEKEKHKVCFTISGEMKEKPPLLYDVVYPKDFTEKIKKTGKYDVLDLARKGMVICFEIIQPKDIIDKALKEVARICWNPNYAEGTILFDIDEWVENANKAFKFVKETGHFGVLPLNLFEGTQHITDLFSKDKQNELDEKCEKGNRRPTSGYKARPIQIKNELAEKNGMEQWCLFISTHDYLIEGYFFDTLLEIHKNNSQKLIDKIEKADKKTKKKKSNPKKKIIPDFPISDNRIPLISSGSKDKKSITENWSKFKLRN